jgi:hypothetical protein
LWFHFSDVFEIPEENPEDREKSDEVSDFMMTFHGTVALIEFTSRSLHVKVQPEQNRNKKKLDVNRTVI